MRTSTRRVEVPRPDKIDDRMRNEVLSSFWQQDPRGVVKQIITGKPSVPVGSRLAPAPSNADPLLGHLREGRADPLTAFLKWRNEVGDIIRVNLAGVTGHLICHPRDIATVLQDNHRMFIKPIHGRRAMSTILGNGLLVSEGKFWLRQRRLAQPAFHRKRIHAFADRMVNAAEDLASQWETRAKTGEAFDVSRDMMHLTLRVVQETLLGTAAMADADRIAKAVTTLIEDVELRMSRVLYPPSTWPTPHNRKLAQQKGFLDESVARMIRERRAGELGDDLLSMLLEVRDADTGEAMDDEQLRDEVLTIFLAGHETTANALSWTFYLLGKHPHVARQLRHELKTVLGDRAPTADDVGKLDYTRMVFSEAMRLYPPAWIMARAPLEDFELGGYHIPAGSRVLMSPWATHRHPDLWDDPEGFDPLRFKDPKAIEKFAYFPFGGGPRLCIGHGFAKMEGVLLLATLARRVHLELVPGHPVEPEPVITLRPRNGIRVTARLVRETGG